LAIQFGTAHGICDGSYMSEASPEFATTAWLLEDSRFPHQAQCHRIAHVSGVTNDVNAYRAELQGLHALLLVVKSVCSFYLITSGSILIGCDNLGALHQAKQLQELTPCSSAHADLIQAICHIHCSLTGITVWFQHVKGHQDDGCLASSLPRITQLNIHADQLAKKALLCLLQHCQHRVGPLVGDQWSLLINGQAISLDPHQPVIWHLGYQTAFQYLVTKKNPISPIGFPLINFPALAQSLKAASPLYHLWYSKFVSGHSATGRMMHL